MRVNIYAEEMTDRVELVRKEVDGQTFTGLRFYLYLPVTTGRIEQRGPFIHQDNPDDDDSSAVTFWGKRDMRKLLQGAINILDSYYGNQNREG